MINIKNCDCFIVVIFGMKNNTLQTKTNSIHFSECTNTLCYLVYYIVSSVPEISPICHVYLFLLLYLTSFYGNLKACRMKGLASQTFTVLFINSDYRNKWQSVSLRTSINSCSFTLIGSLGVLVPKGKEEFGIYIKRTWQRDLNRRFKGEACSMVDNPTACHRMSRRAWMKGSKTVWTESNSKLYLTEFFGR